MEKNFSSNGRKIRRLLDVTHKDNVTVSLSNKTLDEERTGVSNKESEEQMKKYKRHQTIDLIVIVLYIYTNLFSIVFYFVFRMKKI
jgi:hypothetical protein